MRTKAQIDNLRVILCRVDSLAAAILSDSMVDFWGDLVQGRINRIGPLYWLIKVRTEEDGDKSWNDIGYEPKKPCCTYSEIVYNCIRLLSRYSKIAAIEVAEVGNPYDTFVFDRNNSRQKHVL